MFTRNSHVVIDFDGASQAWNANKRKLDNGCYQYICSSMTQKGQLCQNKPLNGCNYCSIHKNRIKSKL